MTKLKADPSLLEVGQMIGGCSSLPGSVHVARLRTSKQQLVEKLFAVKKYFLSDIEDDVSVTNHIHHEVSSLKQFDHPNILSCWTSLVTRDQVWVVTSLAEYSSVRDLLSREVFCDGLPELAICLIIRDLCHGLEYLHSQVNTSL